MKRWNAAVLLLFAAFLVLGTFAVLGAQRLKQASKLPSFVITRGFTFGG